MPMRLICAEDDDHARETLIELLRLSFPDLHIDAVADGASLVERVKVGHYGLVLTDNTMPNLTGLEAIQHIRGFDGKIPIYLLTGDAIQKKAQEVGATGFLPKPLDIHRLHAVVQSYL